MIKCSAIGPRGGQCQRKAQVANGWPLDFCPAHNQQVRDGQEVPCSKCEVTVIADAEPAENEDRQTHQLA